MILKMNCNSPIINKLLNNNLHSLKYNLSDIFWVGLILNKSLLVALGKIEVDVLSMERCKSWNLRWLFFSDYFDEKRIIAYAKNRTWSEQRLLHLRSEIEREMLNGTNYNSMFLKIQLIYNPMIECSYVLL